MGEFMKKINIKDYHVSMGELIDLSNISYHNLMLYYDKYLDKNKKYFITCSKGIHSFRACSILEYLGYDVTQVLK